MSSAAKIAVGVVAPGKSAVQPDHPASIEVAAHDERCQAVRLAVGSAPGRDRQSEAHVANAAAVHRLVGALAAKANGCVSEREIASAFHYDFPASSDRASTTTSVITRLADLRDKR